MPITEVPYKFVQGDKVLAANFMKYDRREDYHWEPNVPFEATIEFVRSAGSTFVVRDINTNIFYWILSSYLVELIKQNQIHYNQIVGQWIVYKQGSTFGIKLV